MMMMMMNSNEMVTQLGSVIATIVFLKALYEQYIPYHWREAINSFLWRHLTKIMNFFSNYHTILVDEYVGERYNRSEAYTRIESYLSEKTSEKARELKASFVQDGKALMLGLGYEQEVTDVFEGVTLWWTSCRHTPSSQTITFCPGDDELKFYRLTFHNRDRKFVTEKYLNHILEEGKSIAIKKRQRKLFTNVKDDGSYNRRGSLWSHVEFKHPATFATLGMTKSKKQSIIDDLQRFSKAKNYYNKIGKPWKRGYLLYGPPGTGKSTMIAAMANLLEYDVYDLELTAVKDNTQLRRLLTQTLTKSIIVIEDIDCSLDLTGQRSTNEKEKEENSKDVGEAVKNKLKEEDDVKKSQVTLSGLLNFIDGIWSACGEERLVVFTTNHIDKLDPALIRRGRMDMHVELSYCCYESFLVLAKNYLDIDEHPLFDEITFLFFLVHSGSLTLFRFLKKKKKSF
ncbi:AAA-ATPase ASD, mitochondrial-like [Silene latifolia]|uniref:AAA-ATPase ASD, mitochondrial-like n=1 Tax=Silene latifolia TaxID=37657 RepID=UPI003D7717DE